MTDSSEGSARRRPGPDQTHARVVRRVATLSRRPYAGPQSGRVRLIPVSRTAARFAAGLPGMPCGKAAQVLAAVPDGFRVDRRGQRWLRHCRSTQVYAGLRHDYRARLDAVLEFFAVARRFDHDVLRPGLAQLQLVLPEVCERTLYRILDTMVQARWITRVQRGSTERYRGVRDGLGSLACEFVLLSPALLISVTPKRTSSRYRKNSLNARANITPPAQWRPHRDQEHSNPRTQSKPLRGTHHSGPAYAGQRRPDKEGARPEREWSARQVTQTRNDRLRAARELQEQLPDLRTISDRALRALLRPWYVAGWSNWDLHYALDHTPGGATHRYGGIGHQVRYLPGWLRSRLALWIAIDPSSTAPGDQPGTTPTQRRQEAADGERAANQAARAAALGSSDEPAATLDVVSAAMTEIRQLLAARRQERHKTSQ